MRISGKFIKRKWGWLILILLVIGIKLYAINHLRVENDYTVQFYLSFAKSLRFLFGWIPFSVGDIIYFVSGGWLLLKIIKNIRLGIKKKFTWLLFRKKFWMILLIITGVYIVFNIFWGLNYDRKGIAWQLKLPPVMYDSANLITMQALLLKKVNETKQILVHNQEAYPETKELYQRAIQCYGQASEKYSFLEYTQPSIKSSLYGLLGDYVGFTGYYNPFTGEAQVNTTVPKFLLPYITLHEMGHQLGYAKEDEANFSGYLAAANSQDTLFQYSAYLDLYTYANREVFYIDSTAAKESVLQLAPAVKLDIIEWKKFNKKYSSVIEPAISWMYGKYLQANQQPQGLRSYNEVVAALISYYKKYGKI